MNEQSLEGCDPIKYIIKPRPLIEDEQSIADNIAYINLQVSLFNHSEIQEDGSWVTPPSFNVIRNDEYASEKEIRLENIAKVSEVDVLDATDDFLEFDCSQWEQLDISYDATITEL